MLRWVQKFLIRKRAKMFFGSIYENPEHKIISNIPPLPEGNIYITNFREKANILNT